jgi:hypothetical protein
MTGPLGGAAGMSDSNLYRSWRHRWQAPWGVLPIGRVAATTKVEDVDGEPLAGAAGISGSGHHRSPFGIHEVPELKVWERPPST